MNLLIDNLPRTVQIAGQDVPINTDYRTGILFEQMITSYDLSDDEKITEALILYYGVGIIPLLTSQEKGEEAIERLMWFYRCGAEQSSKTEAGSGTNEDPAFSYDHDAGYIYAAFLSAYGIDLTEKRLHWWQFRALMTALPDTTQFVKIVGYRTMEIPSKMPKDEKAFYQRMKRQYALPKSADRQQLEDDLNNILENGGDLSAILK